MEEEGKVCTTVFVCVYVFDIDRVYMYMCIPIGGQYYDQPPEPVIPRERPPVLPDPDYTHGNIASKMQTIDYSHGSGMHTVDYNHGAASAATTSPAPPFRDRPKMGADYPREFPPYGGPGQFPPYASQYPATAFPPGPEMYGGMAGSYLPPGLDPATLFLAYSQAGTFACTCAFRKRFCTARCEFY